MASGVAADHERKIQNFYRPFMVSLRLTMPPTIFEFYKLNKPVWQYCTGLFFSWYLLIRIDGGIMITA